MPFSELLLFHMYETDRKHEYTGRLKEWERLHDEAMKSGPAAGLYTPIRTLQEAAAGKLDFMIGDGAKYRFAKLMSLDPEVISGVVDFHSAEENTAIILKQLMETYRKELKIPYLSFDLDFEHPAEEEDFYGLAGV